MALAVTLPVMLLQGWKAVLDAAGRLTWCWGAAGQCWGGVGAGWVRGAGGGCCGPSGRTRLGNLLSGHRRPSLFLSLSVPSSGAGPWRVSGQEAVRSSAEPASLFLVCHCVSWSRSAPLQRVSEVSNHWWYSMLILPPLLKDSVAAPLLSAYYPDCVGMSPSCASTHRTAGSSSPGKLEHSKGVPSSLGESWS